MEEQMVCSASGAKTTMRRDPHRRLWNSKAVHWRSQVHRDLTTLRWFDSDMESSNLACFDDILKQEKSFVSYPIQFR